MATHPSPEARIRALQKAKVAPKENIQRDSIKDSKPMDAMQRAKALIHQGDLKKAVALLRREASYSPDRREVQVALAGALFQSGKLKEAEQTLFLSAQRWPRDPEVHLLLGYCLLEQGEQQKAAPQFHETLKYADNPKVRLAAHLGLAALYEEGEDKDQGKANHHYAHVLAIAPQMEEILVNIQEELLWQEPIVAEGEGFGGQRADRYRKSRIESELRKLQR